MNRNSRTLSRLDSWRLDNSRAIISSERTLHNQILHWTLVIAGSISKALAVNLPILDVAAILKQSIHHGTSFSGDSQLHVSRTDKREIKVNVFRGEYVDIYNVVREAAREGFNVGTDEYPSLEILTKHLDNSVVLGLWSNDGEAPEVLSGICTISPCSLARGLPTVIAEMRIFATNELHGKNPAFIGPLVKMAESIVSDIGEHYCSTIIQVAVLCSAWCLQLKKVGYTVTACIPDSVNLAGEGGLTPNFVFYKKQRNISEETKVRVISWICKCICLLEQDLSEQLQLYNAPRLPGCHCLVSKRALVLVNKCNVFSQMKIILIAYFL